MTRSTLQKIRINSQGYDPSGSYWGIGAPLYWTDALGEPGEGYFFRAPDRNAAKIIIRAHNPAAKFFT